MVNTVKKPNDNRITAVAGDSNQDLCEVILKYGVAGLARLHRTALS